MKDFINKLELAFDKKLDKTNYGRNQIKELFLRACIEVLADTRVSKTPYKEEGEELFLKHKATVLPKFKFTDPKTEDTIILNQYKWEGNKHWTLGFTNQTTGVPIVKGETSVEQLMFDDILQLYYFYKEQIPF